MSKRTKPRPASASEAAESGARLYGSLYPQQTAHILRGKVTDKATRSKSGRTITIKLEDGQKLKLKTDHMTVDVDVAVVIVENPRDYVVQLIPKG